MPNATSYCTAFVDAAQFNAIVVKTLEAPFNGSGPDGADRRSCRSGARDRRRHIRLNLRGGQRRVVDADVVDQTGERPAVHQAPANLQRRAGRADQAACGMTVHLRAVHEQPHHRPVIRHRDMRPGVGRQGVRTRHHRQPTADGPASGRRCRAVGQREHIIVGALVDEDLPAWHPHRGRRRIDPGFQRHRRGQVKRRRVRHGHVGGAPIERQRTAEFARRGPRRAGQRARATVAGRIARRRARALVEAIRSNRHRAPRPRLSSNSRPDRSSTRPRLSPRSASNTSCRPPKRPVDTSSTSGCSRRPREDWSCRTPRHTASHSSTRPSSREWSTRRRSRRSLASEPRAPSAAPRVSAWSRPPLTNSC